MTIIEDENYKRVSELVKLDSETRLVIKAFFKQGNNEELMNELIYIIENPPDYKLVRLLEEIPFSFRTSEGHDLSLERRYSDNSRKEQYLLAELSYPDIILLKPRKGERLSDGSFYGKKAKFFYPSRVMDECTGGGACCSYVFEPRALGLDYDWMVLDIHKLG
jgi:hypothetical protein